MLSGWIILLTALVYLLVLFAIAYYGDKRTEAGRGLEATPYIYSLSIAVYCTSWTFYGSVGRAAQTGVGFLPIYLGPTLSFVLGWFLLRKIIRISKAQRITSIADFIASRYGKSQALGGLVTIIATIGIVPYISLQLKAVASSFDVLLHYPELSGATQSALGLADTALVVTAVLALFSILFGTRHLDATEHHGGMIVAIAFESVVKLVAFLAVGLFVTFGLFDGFGDLFGQALQRPELARLMTFDAAGTNWVTLTLLAMLAIICLPRQFQVTVVENVDESHLTKAMWMFPLYLLLINIFVLPIAFGGLLWFPDGGVDADTFVLALPMAEQRPFLALLVFIGGLSAATAMVIVATVALSTMVSNDLVMPALIQMGRLQIAERTNLSGLLLGIRRSAILVILLLAYVYYRLVGDSYALVSIGLVSFAAAAQFAPVMLAGIFWRGGTRRGAIAGLSAGFAVWLYTLLLPSFARSGWIAESFLTAGPFGLEFLRPYALLGIGGLDPISHAMFWSMILNTGAFLVVSLLDRPSSLEQNQATLFVEVFRQGGQTEAPAGAWQGSALVKDLRALAEKFVGKERAEAAFARHARERGVTLDASAYGDAALVQVVERLIAGSIGSASARITIASAVKGEGVSPEQVMSLLDETTQVLEYSRQLEQKSEALEAATRDLQEANERLRELDRLKDEFLSTVTHELRTPLTSIRSFSEILHDDPEIEPEEQKEFLGIIISESERLTRLINEVLELAKIQAGRMQWKMEDVDLKDVVESSVTTLSRVFEQADVRLEAELPESVPLIHADRDRLVQVVINLLSNAQKFCPPGTGRVKVALECTGSELVTHIKDNGPGIPKADCEAIFDQFHQVRAGQTGNPKGTGLGLAICQHIVDRMGGRIWVESVEGEGADFIFAIPRTR
ncbi:MAG: sensor histidine kinase [Kiloniellales bacterium]|nr:sensor histidine kinase [Kiloniellales bacterium]